MDSLRVDNGIKRIEVNDAGECVEFSISDSNFLASFWEFGTWLKEKEKEIEDLKKNNDDPDQKEEKVFESTGKVIDLRNRINKEASEKIDKIFGSEASRKIFGSVIPDLYMITDFLNKITPFIEKYTKERRKIIDGKYNKNRKGAKT